MDRRQVWRATLGELEISLSQATFETWFRRTALLRVDEASSTFTIGVSSGFAKDWIEERYRSLIAQTIAKIVGYSVTLQVEVVSEAELDAHGALAGKRSASADGATPLHAAAPAGDAVRVVDASEPTRPTNLNARYTFATYVVGSASRLAHAASQSVSERPGGAYNPLFLYGGTGLGKTHLLHAIGNAVMERSPKRRVLYITGEAFTNEFILSIQQGAADAFRSRFRKIDVLLIDDIQFIADKERTQEEFFHTFNALYHSDRQIVVTSDVYPQQIGEMEERLVSRFQSGMVADIQPPELDTRIAILKKKAEAEKIHLTDDVALFIAQVVKSNVRELEGTLLRIAVKAELLGRGIDLDLTKDSLRAALPAPEQALTVEDVQRAVCTYFNLKLGDLKSKRRHRAVSYPRQVAMYLCRQRLGTSYPELGERFGGKDHTTVISAVRKIDGLVGAEDETTRRALEAIGRKLGL